ncbi:MAG: ABC transporter ATP-binding protein, partial [Candidatus Bathyarchaeia archaeon]
VQAQVLKLLEELKKKLGMSLILISHDLSLIAEICEKTAVMYAGHIVEIGDSTSIFKNPQHPYTMGLILSFPNIKSKKTKMISIPGSPPDLLDPPQGCRFHPRCKYALEICRKQVPELIPIEKNHMIACHLYQKS